MNKLQRFLEASLGKSIDELLKIAPPIQEFHNIPEFLESIFELKLRNACVLVLKMFARDYNYSEEDEIKKANPLIGLKWIQGTEKRHWLGPDMIHSISIEKSGNLIVIYQNANKKPERLVQSLSGGCSSLNERMGTENKNILCFYNGFKRDYKGFASFSHALVSSEQGLSAELTCGLHELVHLILRQTRYYNLRNDFEFDMFSFEEEKATRLVREAHAMEEGFISNEVNEILGTPSDLSLLYYEPLLFDATSPLQVRDFLKKKTKTFCGRYSLNASLFAFMSEEMGQKGSECLSSIFKVMRETVYPRQAICKMLFRKWNDVLDDWADKIFSQKTLVCPEQKLLWDIFGKRLLEGFKEGGE